MPVPREAGERNGKGEELVMNRPGKIVFVGRIYAEHAAELGNTLPEEPLLFFKPPSAVISDREAIRLPEESSQVEHEAEVGVVIGARLPTRSVMRALTL